MNEGGDFLLVLWAHVSLPGFWPNRFNASQHIAPTQAHCSAPLGWATSHAHSPRTIPGNLMRLATDTEPSDRIFFAGRLLAVPRLWCGNSLAVAGPNALNSEHPHGSPTSDNKCWDDSPTR